MTSLFANCRPYGSVAASPSACSKLPFLYRRRCNCLLSVCALAATSRLPITSINSPVLTRVVASSSEAIAVPNASKILPMNSKSSCIVSRND